MSDEIILKNLSFSAVVTNVHLFRIDELVFDFHVVPIGFFGRKNFFAKLYKCKLIKTFYHLSQDYPTHHSAGFLFRETFVVVVSILLQYFET
jgi:hypothetical protein